MSGASLLFAAGQRPRGVDIRALASGTAAGFSISLDRADEPAGDAGCWQELLVSGLTYDLAGLAPGPAAGPPSIAHAFGLPQPAPGGFETVVVRPGPHLAAGAAMLPVVRMLAWVTAQFCALPSLVGVVWHPARCLSAPAAFRSGVMGWLEGGAFPAFSLAALATTPDDALQSEGLALFIGQELRFEPASQDDPAGAAKLAVRLMHRLVETGPVREPTAVEGPDGQNISLDLTGDGRLVRARIS